MNTESDATRGLGLYLPLPRSFPSGPPFVIPHTRLLYAVPFVLRITRLQSVEKNSPSSLAPSQSRHAVLIMPNYGHPFPFGSLRHGSLNIFRLWQPHLTSS
jgi:hypothetical protein